MSVEEASGWSVRDNHCSTLKQYIISAFTPKGRLRRRDFFFTLLAILIVMYVLAYIPAYVRAQECIGWEENMKSLFPEVTLPIYGTLWDEMRTNAIDITVFAIFCLVSVSAVSVYPVLWFVIFCLSFKMRDTVPYSSITVFAWLMWTFIFVYLIYCCTIRRLHDSGYNGWNLLLVCIPFVSLFLFYLLLIANDAGYQNKYGSDPRLPYEGQYVDCTS